jgi:hypothetical protein
MATALWVGVGFHLPELRETKGELPVCKEVGEQNPGSIRHGATATDGHALKTCLSG